MTHTGQVEAADREEAIRKRALCVLNQHILNAGHAFLGVCEQK
jgi:hypothetical protein